MPAICVSSIVGASGVFALQLLDSAGVVGVLDDAIVSRRDSESLRRTRIYY